MTCVLPSRHANVNGAANNAKLVLACVLGQPDDARCMMSHDFRQKAEQKEQSFI